MKVKLHETVDLETMNAKNGNRYYILPGEAPIAVPSVTTVLYRNSTFEDTPNSYQARERGTTIHKMMEDYIKTGETEFSGSMPADWDMFLGLKKEIDENLDEVNFLEACVWSKNFQSAGRLDLGGLWKSKKSLVDFKTSKYPKKEEWVIDYFTQLTAYSVFMYESYNLLFSNLVLVIGVDHDHPQIFESHVSDHYKRFKEIFVR